jgi:hypothetical protein
MDGSEGVKLVQQVVLGLYISKVPLRAALNDLCAALREPEATADLDGVLATWRKVVSEPILPNKVCYGLPKLVESRAQTALRLAREQGKITSSALAQELGVSQETARLQLTAMAEARQLTPVGGWKQRYYVIGRNSGTEQNAQVGVSAAE